MGGIPQLRVAGWFITDSDRDPVRHLFLRVEQTMDGTGVWTVELHECRGRLGTAGKAMHRYPTEADARAAVDLILQLSRHLVPLPCWDSGRSEPGRWRICDYEYTRSEQHRRERLVGPSP